MVEMGRLFCLSLMALYRYIDAATHSCPGRLLSRNNNHSTSVEPDITLMTMVARQGAFSQGTLGDVLARELKRVTLISGTILRYNVGAGGSTIRRIAQYIRRIHDMMVKTCSFPFIDLSSFDRSRVSSDLAHHS